ncbi:methyl-accepting chemotaxis protein [Methylomagnum ishizawai]|uniref:Methyl-accepting chemotaxis protein n=1 Tax=Methylomagnum ishizawai TaxID=1760988 RepID=A0A1Y6D0K1_9GAMM|nr:methyl-accepting chemotaxis protein [Methylomagnum ishizawai]SMF96469.1 methyl-accepting chemotaxis protein [Methylomagnum ishizawai]
MLNNMKIRAKLAMGFGLLLLFGAMIATVGIWRLLDLQADFKALSGPILARERLTHQGLAQMGDGVHYFKNAILRGKDYPAKFEAAMAGIEQTVRDYRLTAEPAPEERALLETIDQELKQYRNAMATVVEMLAKGATPTQIDNSVAGADKALAAALEKLMVINIERGTQSQRQFNQQLDTGIPVLLGIMALMITLGVFTAKTIIANITRPLARAVELAQGIAAGNIEQALSHPTGRDETAELLAAMASMADTLKSFAAAQLDNVKKHASGGLDDQIDAGRFPGIYGQMACSINDLVQSHIAVKKRVVEIVKRYAQGDLSVDMDRLPGQKREITEAIDSVKTSLQAINREIKTLAHSAVNGDFTVRGRADQYHYEFREMVEGLNALMEVSDRGLAEVARVLGALAEGDLTQRIDGDYRGTFGQLRDASNATVERLREMVERIHEASQAVNNAAQEIAAGNADLSRRTEEQASSLDEISSAMERLNATVTANASGAGQANALVQHANGAVEQGGDAVGRLVAAMGEIQERSRKIADITGVIDGIAFQTNILALNATVEAARAGEQGRGFAVVANEVRSLAQRSASAAKEIKGLIASSAEKVDTGVAQATQAGEVMEEVVGGFGQVRTLMEEISTASQDQAHGIGQIAQAIGQMDKMTQHNAALVEEAAAAAESLGEQARSLVAAMSAFKLA